MNCEDGVCGPEGMTKEQAQPIEDKKDKIIYFGDAMCSWCWGITNNLDKLKENFKDQVDFQLVLGGLRPGGGDQWTPEFREMIKGHWEHVEKASGQPFDYSFFERENFNYDTEPSARAVRVVRDLAPEKEWKFYKALHRYFYAENKDITDVNVLKSLCAELGIDANQFETLFLSPGYKQLVKQDFAKAQQFGISGFPSVVLQKGAEYYAVSRGFSTFEKMNDIVNEILATSKSAEA